MVVAVLVNDDDIGQNGSGKNAACRLTKKEPRDLATAGFCLRSGLWLLQHHRRERIDIGLQRHEDTD
jgi:hypothetical protein